ncbi:MAG: hypothetical protein AAFP19_22740, partial [Bacteroidota bacterium]
DTTNGALIYNYRAGLQDPNALMFFHQEDIDNTTFKLKKGKAIEPLIIRSKAGHCVVVDLYNRIDTTKLNTFGADPDNQHGLSPSQPFFGGPVVDNADYHTILSPQVGLTPQLVSIDVTTSDGTNAGFNPVQTVSPDLSANATPIRYEWYAGGWEDGQPFAIEFGSIPLTAPDVLNQYVYGLFGALIIEPANSVIQVDANSRLSASIKDADNDTLLFREFVNYLQQDMTIGTDQGVNYKTEPFKNRLTNPPGNLNMAEIQEVLSNNLDDPNNPGHPIGAPETPTFTVTAGDPVRLRMIHSLGRLNGDVMTLHGHVWQELPYSEDSREIVKYNPNSQWQGSHGQLSAANRFDLVLEHAGGSYGITGDYLLHTFPGNMFQNGTWSLMNVTPPYGEIQVVQADVDTKVLAKNAANKAKLASTIKPRPVDKRKKSKKSKIKQPIQETQSTLASTEPGMTVRGFATIDPTTGKFAKKLTVYAEKGSLKHLIASTNINPTNGEWILNERSLTPAGAENAHTIFQLNSGYTIILHTDCGAERTYSIRQIQNLAPNLIDEMRNFVPQMVEYKVPSARVPLFPGSSKPDPRYQTRGQQNNVGNSSTPDVFKSEDK